MPDATMKKIIKKASAEENKEKCNKPRWCPSGLTRTQKRKLQRLRQKEEERKEEEKREELFNQMKPVVPQKQQWVPKTTAEPMTQVLEPVEPVSQTGQVDLAKASTVDFVEDRALSDTLKVALSVEIPEDDDEELVDYEPSPEPI